MGFWSMAEHSPATSTEKQLAAIASFSSLLDQQGLDYWLFGGWAVDCCVVVWSTEPLGDKRRHLLGVGSRTIPLALLRAGKSIPREGQAEAAKDLADLDVLSQRDP
jgi:hypothetical protein